MSETKVSDFEIMKKIAEENTTDGIGLFPDLLRGASSPMGGELTFGVPAEAFAWSIKDSHYFVLYAVKKDDYKRVCSELINT